MVEIYVFHDSEIKSKSLLNYALQLTQSYNKSPSQVSRSFNKSADTQNGPVNILLSKDSGLPKSYQSSWTLFRPVVIETDSYEDAQTYLYTKAQSS